MDSYRLGQLRLLDLCPRHPDLPLVPHQAAEQSSNAKPTRPDPVYAKKQQEVLGGQFGEISVMMQYLFQGWNCRAEGKYRDMLLDIATEEIAHVEMLARWNSHTFQSTFL